MTRKLFGTDGIRGVANRFPMTAGTALRLGQAAGRLFRRGNHGNRVLIGKDTRLSGYMLEPALTAGFTSAGMNVLLVGPLPTPAVAFLTRSLRADLGVMVSASHNAFDDNGIKLFGPDGFKLSDETERQIEAFMDDLDPSGLPEGAGLGRAQRIEDARGRYIENLKSSFPRDLTLEGLKVVIDAANGAGYGIAPDLLWELGAEVHAIGVSPNGLNINDKCGSTSPEALRRAVLEHGADVGIALDGDADRLLLTDEAGQEIDGDQILAMIARRLQEDGRLRGGRIVATIMSNLGLENHLKANGIGLVRTKVGDRYVAEAMREGGLNVGGEQSGHVILSDFATTGDGLLAALQILACLRRAQRPLSEIGRMFEPVPQQLRNVRVADRGCIDTPEIKAMLRHFEGQLGQKGRLVVRPSGTEPLIRVMVEAEDSGTLASVLREVSEAIEATAAR